MGRVFVSHANEDQRVARQVHRLLVEAGHHVFLDVDHGGGIRAGEGWERRLHAELRGADAVVCVVSPSYVANQWCAIEIAVAKSLGTRLIPLSVQPACCTRYCRSCIIWITRPMRRVYWLWWTRSCEV